MSPNSTLPIRPSVADIATIDFDRLSQGDPSQARLLLHSCQNYGFFYLSNHHVDSRFMFTLADAVFSLPLDEKLQYDMGTTGHYYGYERSGAMFVDEKGTRDQTEFYNISKDEALRVPQADGRRWPATPHPPVVLARFSELQTFIQSCHRIVHTITASLGKSLGLPSGLLESLHGLDQPSCDQARVTHASPVRASTTITVGEHTDFGSVTVLFNQLGGFKCSLPTSATGNTCGLDLSARSSISATA